MLQPLSECDEVNSLDVLWNSHLAVGETDAALGDHRFWSSFPFTTGFLG